MTSPSSMAMPASPAVLADQVLGSLPNPLVVLDQNDAFVFINRAAEEFLQASRSRLVGQKLENLIGNRHRLFDLIGQARHGGIEVSDDALDIESPRFGHRLVNIQVNGLAEKPGFVVVAMQERALAERLRGQESLRGAARSMSSLSALLAHEIKNPLAGIRGAAQLLEHKVDTDSLPLTGLIIEETDRIASLLTRMETLAGGMPIQRLAVNIHEVLDHCLKLARSSFARDMIIDCQFDPSLPPALGDRNLLIQSFLNIIKNAAEAIDNNGKILIRTSYSAGVRLALPQQEKTAATPLIVEIMDTGPGISSSLRERIFDPFVSSKANGSGLGLAMVAGTMADHGGTVDVTSRPGQTCFRLGLPVAAGDIGEPADG